MYCRIGSASLKHETPRSRTFLFRFAFSSISWHSSSASKRNGERSGEGNVGRPRRRCIWPSANDIAHRVGASLMAFSRPRVSPARDLAIYRPNNRTRLDAIRRRHASPTRPIAALSSRPLSSPKFPRYLKTGRTIAMFGWSQPVRPYARPGSRSRRLRNTWSVSR